MTKTWRKGYELLYPAREDFKKDIIQNNLCIVEERNKLVAIYVISQECDNEYNKCSWIC